MYYVVVLVMHIIFSISKTAYSVFFNKKVSFFFFSNLFLLACTFFWD